MSGTVWRWLIWAVMAWAFVTSAIRAFAAPWTWTFDQGFVVFCLCGAVLIAAIWLGVWLKHGTAGVRERLEFGRQVRAGMRPNPKRTAINFAIWIVIGAVLVVAFNIYQH